MDSSPHKKLAQHLFASIRRDDVDAVSKALSEGASPNWLELGPRSFSLKKKNEPVEQPSDSAFLFALRLGALKSAEVLFHMADLSICGQSGQTAPNLAVRTKSLDWVCRICSLADPSARNADGRDALRVAVDLNFLEAVSYLITHPAVDPNQFPVVHYDHQSYTPLCAATVLGLSSVAKILAPITKNLGKDFPQSPSPLALCATHNRLDIAKMLIESGALHKPCEKGLSLWNLAAARGHVEFLKWALSNYGPMTESDRESLLLSAAAGGSRDCVGIAFSMLPSISPTLAARALKDASPIGDFKAFLAVEIERQAISQASAPGRGSTAPQLRL